nr:gonadotropin subunit beta-2-like [Chelonoidis abingdonii]
MGSGGRPSGQGPTPRGGRALAEGGHRPTGGVATCPPALPLSPQEPVYKSALAPVSQHVCSYRAVRYETLALPVCPPGVDPAFTFPVALSCHCSLCLMDSSDCTVHSIGPDFCSARGGFA